MFPADHAPSEHGKAAPDALLALGRLDGALAMARPATLRLFAMRLLRDMLLTALRQEGHCFTDQRFHAWFAGVATLSDEPARMARPPRALCEAILTELAHSSCDHMAAAAMRFQAALLAPSDDLGSGHTATTAHQDAGCVIAAAHDLLEGLAPSPHPLEPHPLAALAQLHHAARAHVLFAPSERAVEPIAMASLRLTVERVGPPSPRWALELLWGEHWRKAGLLACALPFPGLIRLDALQGGTRTDTQAYPGEPCDTPTILAAGLRDVAQGLLARLTEADRIARRLEERQPGQRRSSRAPALLELLAGFGPIRSAQIERLLGVTRLGLRTMLGAVEAAGMLARTTISGVHLYAANPDMPVVRAAEEIGVSSTFSPAALGEFDAAMASIDALLARRGVNSEDTFVDEDQSSFLS